MNRARAMARARARRYFLLSLPTHFSTLGTGGRSLSELVDHVAWSFNYDLAKEVDGPFGFGFDEE